MRGLVCVSSLKTQVQERIQVRLVSTGPVTDLVSTNASAGTGTVHCTCT